MILVATAACLGWVATACLIWVLAKAERAEREELRVEIRMAQTEITSLVRAHAEQLERITEAHRKEVATLCQRIQAPQVAVAQHLPADLPPDPSQPHLDDDDALYELHKRERELDDFAASLQSRAEELAAER